MAARINLAPTLFPANFAGVLQPRSACSSDKTREGKKNTAVVCLTRAERNCGFYREVVQANKSGLTLATCSKCRQFKQCYAFTLLGRDRQWIRFGCPECEGLSVIWTPDESRVHKPKPKPGNHLYFYDCERESMARSIAWSLRRKKDDHWFATLTFPSFISVDRAHRLRNRWLSRLNQALMDRSARHGGKDSCTAPAGLRWISATEWQVRHVVHFHLLLSACRFNLLSRKSWEVRWKSISGGFGCIYPALMQCAPYLAKYSTKEAPGTGVEWGGAWQGLVLPTSVSCCSPER